MDMKLFTYAKIYGNYTKGEIKALYADGKILINNELLPLSCPIRDGDIVTINNRVIENNIEFKYYKYYKPRGVLSVINDKPDSLINFIPRDIKLSPAGRLDKESEGLLILSNDGKFINELINSDYSHEKEYIVEVKYPITNEFLEGIRGPHVIRGRATTPMRVERIDAFHLDLILYEGIYHQIRTIIKENNNVVLSLKRIRVRNYTLDDMLPNEIREIKRTV